MSFLRRLPATGIIGLIIVCLTVLAALISLLWTPYDPLMAIAADRLQGSSAEHLLGTDRFGRDVLSRLMVGAQITLFVGLVAVSISALIGVPLGIAAGMRRGKFLDSLVMRTADLLLAFPALLLAIIAGAVWGPSTLTAMIAIGIAGIPSFARVARSGTLQVMSQDFIAAARVSKVSELTIATRHVFPNITGLVIVQASVYFALAILAEAALSYLGLGTAPPAASWGRMLQDAQSLLAVQPSLTLWPGLAIALTVLGFNLLGDALRDVLDPRQTAQRN
ncbi:MAG: ABC transporter permease [Corynebacterium casei]|uniref:ABC transporter permease n=1 Tax=Corynebacterium casei TaxID=160386 RepID=UPI00264A4D46|nr:ABC transporter permease [Corynebacterium casei]MDN5800106.1 ABC transporter permease [Corynebacterium casei]MDN5922643.1 ABC transporter permease [Corynebacterium casei]MDN6245584.1 ABC transporter permease [Corynebacterium casei]MDN6273540.1 ABC transporter permease [Corynebacterium casei]MDN6285624.1 ABC transporter permease [Corynebacterium casei]